MKLSERCPSLPFFKRTQAVLKRLKLGLKLVIKCIGYMMMLFISLLFY